MTLSNLLRIKSNWLIDFKPYPCSHLLMLNIYLQVFFRTLPWFLDRWLASCLPILWTSWRWRLSFFTWCKGLHIGHSFFLQSKYKIGQSKLTQDAGFLFDVLVFAVLGGVGHVGGVEGVVGVESAAAAPDAAGLAVDRAAAADCMSLFVFFWRDLFSKKKKQNPSCNIVL